MGKHHIKCLVCRCEKDDYPELRFYKLPENRERREIWLSNLDKTDLIKAKISEDCRICEKHFSHDMFGKSKLRLKRNAVPINEEREIVSDKSTNILRADVLIPPRSLKCTEIGGNMEIWQNVDVKEELPETSNENNSALIGENMEIWNVKEELSATFNENNSALISGNMEIYKIEDVKEGLLEISNETNSALIGGNMRIWKIQDVKEGVPEISNETNSALIGGNMRIWKIQDVKEGVPEISNDTNSELIGGNMEICKIEEVKEELLETSNEKNITLIFPKMHKSTQTTSIVENSEYEVNKLREECKELRKQITELRKEKDSVMFYIERTKRILPEELARRVESYLSNLHH